MARPLLKICGVTNIPDLRCAQAAGADSLGVVVEAPSPRAVSVEVAARLSRRAPGRMVAVVVSSDESFLRRVIDELAPRALQLHGPNTSELVSRLADKCPLWVAVPVPPAGQAGAAPEQRESEALAVINEAASAGAELIVLDTQVGGQSGGTGQVSDWVLAARLVAASPLPVLLAGGICPGNAAEALAQVRPAGLDASSRLERSPGRKDPCRVRELGRVIGR